MSDARRDGEQRFGALAAGGHRRRPCRHLHECRGTPLFRGAFETVTKILQSEQLVQSVEFVLEDLTGQGVEVAVDEHTTLERRRCRQRVLVGIPGGFVRVGVVDVAFGVELPHPDLFGRRGEHVAWNRTHQLGFGCGEVGVDPGPVTRRNQIDMCAIHITRRIGGFRERHRPQGPAAAHQPLRVTLREPGLTGQAGTWCFRAVVGPRQGRIPPMHDPHDLRLQTVRHDTQPADHLVQLVTRQGFDIDASKQLHRFFEKSETCRHSQTLYEHMSLSKTDISL